MLAVIKRYSFPGQPGRVTESVMFTSYPGLLASSDDFYTTSSQQGSMVVLETTNPNYNASSYDLVVPQTVLYWQRVMAANYLADSAPSWMRLAARHNSGTYNNMWMVVDYKLFTPRRPLAPNTFWVGEQAPGFWHAEDQTRTLAYGYWPSYNKALYRGTAVRTGQDEMVRLHGMDYSYSLTPRAEIFRHDQGLVTDEAAMRRVLRYNRYQIDPLANHSACNQLACRGDLLPSPIADGAVNAKFTSAARLAKGQLLFVAGPTHDDQPVFKWSTAPASVQQMPHAGQPDRWDFDWAVYQSGRPARVSEFSLRGVVSTLKELQGVEDGQGRSRSAEGGKIERKTTSKRQNSNHKCRNPDRHNGAKRQNSWCCGRLREVAHRARGDVCGYEIAKYFQICHVKCQCVCHRSRRAQGLSTSLHRHSSVCEVRACSSFLISPSTCIVNAQPPCKKSTHDIHEVHSP